MATPHKKTTAIIEKLLSDAFGSKVRIEVGEDLGGKDYWTVQRCKVIDAPKDIPGSVIVKQATGNEKISYEPDSTQGVAPRLFDDWAGLQFLSEVAGDQSPVARFYGGNREAGIIVIEDLGTGTSLNRIMMGNNAADAEAGLIEFVKTNGRMHALTIGKKAEYDRIRDPLGPREKPASLMEEWRRLVRNLMRACDAAGIEPRQSSEAEIKTVAAFITEPGPFAAYTHGDPIPGNDLPVGNQRKLFDFEYGDFRHALRDGIYPHIGFPTWWYVNRVPDHVVQHTEAVYRTELLKGCPEAGDDEKFYRAIVEACAYWTVNLFIDFIPGLLEKDRERGHTTMRHCVLFWLETFAKTAGEFGYLEALGATIREMTMKLRVLWLKVGEMPYYPAFR